MQSDVDAKPKLVADVEGFICGARRQLMAEAHI
jgi:hypothetical protein